MTFWQRLDNFKLELETRFRYHFWEQEIWSLANAASPGFPDLRELLKEGVFFFVDCCGRKERFIILQNKYSVSVTLGIGFLRVVAAQPEKAPAVACAPIRGSWF